MSNVPIIVNVKDIELNPMAFNLAPDEPPMEFDCKLLWVSEDKRHLVGLESITPAQNETAPKPGGPGVPFSQSDYFISGHVLIDIEGRERYEAKGDDIVVSSAGTKSVWDIKETLFKLFVMWSDEPFDVDSMFAPRTV